MDCSSITDFQQSTAIRIAKKFRNLHIGFLKQFVCFTLKTVRSIPFRDSFCERPEPSVVPNGPVTYQQSKSSLDTTSIHRRREILPIILFSGIVQNNSSISDCL